MKTLHAFLTLSTAALLAAPAGLSAEEKKPAGERPVRQAGAARLNPEARLKELTEKLSLTPEQQEKVKAVYAKNVETLKTMREDKSLSEEAKRQKFTEMRRTEMQEINGILTPEQQEKMKTLFRKRAGAARGAQTPAEKKPEAK
jgi:Spy/CpxP family protein refolding chaperone